MKFAVDRGYLNAPESATRIDLADKSVRFDRRCFRSGKGFAAHHQEHPVRRQSHSAITIESPRSYLQSAVRRKTD